MIMTLCNQQCSLTMKAIDNYIHPHGLLLRGALHPPEGGTVVLVGNAGPGLWQAFARARRAEDRPHELDAWTRRVMEPVAAAVGARVVFPFEGPPYHPFQRWAMAAEGLKPSPVGVLMHPVFGLWHAYRAALLFDARLPLPESAPAPHPCDSCDAKPCLSACPVGAFTAGGYDVAACRAHVRSAAGEACRAGGCLARHACPVGEAYAPGQAAFHMAAFAGLS